MGRKIGVGLIGTGRRGYALAAYIARMRDATGLEIRALNNRTSVRMKDAQRGLAGIYSQSGPVPPIRLYGDYQELIADPEIDLVIVATPQYAHRDPAVRALNSGKKVNLDKPLAHNLGDALAICREQERTGNRILMSFTRRYESPWIKTYEMAQQGLIGDIKMIQVRNVIPYHVFFHTWHRRLEWSGGALADKMSHAFDVFNWFAAGRPARLTAFGGQAVFVPKPDAPERCSHCGRQCPYRVASFNGLQPPGERLRQDVMVEFGHSRLSETEIIKRHDTCVWYPGADINDHGLVSVQYDNGVKAALFWSLFGPDSDDQETLELVGETGRIILTRHTGTIDIVADHGKRHEVVHHRDASFTGSHFGADENLVLALEKFCQGATPAATAIEGLLASRMVEAAHRSIQVGGELIEMAEVEDCP
ncbi:MAG: Gfo/Idh/MocA family oxidoreductase [Spirochaetales bacterium]|nr:Gfo/Idh/MocA family oxidoreductase [Spirochaetales bacterium]